LLSKCISRDDAERFHISLGFPRYPRRPEGSRILTVGWCNDSKTIAPEESIDQLIAEQKSLLNPLKDRVQRSKLLEIVEARAANKKPSIFLSYPKAATGHADILKKRLGQLFSIQDYQEPNLAVIVHEVLKRISACDYFIGIWHHDEHSGTGISPWMPFELGVAHALGKKYLVVHSKKLGEDVWKRIDPQIAQPAYDDLTFEKNTVPLIEEACQYHFVEAMA